MRAVAEGQQFLTEKPPWELLPDCRAGSGCCTGGSLQGCSWIAGTQLGRPSPGTGPDTADVSRDLCWKTRYLRSRMKILSVKGI